MLGGDLPSFFLDQMNLKIKINFISKTTYILLCQFQKVCSIGGLWRSGFTSCESVVCPVYV